MDSFSAPARTELVALRGADGHMYFVPRGFCQSFISGGEERKILFPGIEHCNLRPFSGVRVMFYSTLFWQITESDEE